MGVCSLRTDDAIVRDAAILYSLGNFVTTQPGVELQTGIVATVSLDPDVTGLGWTPVATSRVDGWRQVHPLQELVEGSADHAREVTRLDEHLGTGWKR